MADSLVREGKVSYAKPIHRALLRDARLSFGARGLFAFIWDLPRNWGACGKHLATMSPAKRDAIRTSLKELEAVGALRIEPIQQKGGKITGRRWVVRSPALWAIEFPLVKIDEGEKGPSERRKSRRSSKPTVEKSDTKVLQQKGYPETSTTGIEDAELERYVEAAIWVAASKVRNPTAYRHTIRERVSSDGPNQADKEALEAYDKAAELRSQRVPPVLAEMQPSDDGQRGYKAFRDSKIARCLGGREATDVPHAIPPS